MRTRWVLFCFPLLPLLRSRKYIHHSLKRRGLTTRRRPSRSKYDRESTYLSPSGAQQLPLRPTSVSANPALFNCVQRSVYRVVDGHFYCLISQLASSGVRDNGFCSLINIRQLGVVTKPSPGVVSRYNGADSYLGSLCMSSPRPGRRTHKSVAIHRSVCGLHSDQWERGAASC